MRVDSGDSNSNIIIRNSNIENWPKSENNADKSKKIQTSSKSVSQMNDYDIGVMPVSERVVIEAIQKANRAISGGNRRFEFSIHDKTNEIVVKVFDSETDTLIKEIPNEKILDMVAKICEMAGILVDERR